jgi:reactive chlorine resistance protein C
MSALEANLNADENVLQAVGRLIVRYGLVLILLWIGAMKFTSYEAMGIEPLVASSPLMSWLYKVLSLRAVSNLLGLTEITTGLLIASYPFSKKAAMIGSVLAVFSFLTTLTFLFSLPGWEKSLGGFPALSGTAVFY